MWSCSFTRFQGFLCHVNEGVSASRLKAGWLDLFMARCPMQKEMQKQQYYV
jgi:hypothetical protein